MSHRGRGKPENQRKEQKVGADGSGGGLWDAFGTNAPPKKPRTIQSPLLDQINQMIGSNQIESTQVHPEQLNGEEFA